MASLAARPRNLDEEHPTKQSKNLFPRNRDQNVLAFLFLTELGRFPIPTMLRGYLPKADHRGIQLALLNEFCRMLKHFYSSL